LAAEAKKYWTPTDTNPFAAPLALFFMENFSCPCFAKGTWFYVDNLAIISG